MSNNTSLGGGRPRLVYNQLVHSSELAQAGSQSFAGSVVSNHTNDRPACTERYEVCEHICSAAEMYRFSTNINHRHGRLWRNPRDVAPDKFVEHYVAEHEHVSIAQSSQDF
jgi:hypothetical protein